MITQDTKNHAAGATLPGGTLAPVVSKLADSLTATSRIMLPANSLPDFSYSR